MLVLGVSLKEKEEGAIEVRVYPVKPDVAEDKDGRSVALDPATGGEAEHGEALAGLIVAYFDALDCKRTGGTVEVGESHLAENPAILIQRMIDAQRHIPKTWGEVAANWAHELGGVSFRDLNDLEIESLRQLFDGKPEPKESK